MALDDPRVQVSGIHGAAGDVEGFARLVDGKYQTVHDGLKPNRVRVFSWVRGEIVTKNPDRR
jgi:hypothetical protein